MKKSVALTVGSCVLLSILAFTLTDPSAAGRSAFTTSVAGDLATTASGEAEFGLVDPGPGVNPAIALTLGARSGSSAVVFTKIGAGHLQPGVYQISEEGELRGMLITGTPEKPTGVFRAESGILTITSASDVAVQGKFELKGKGFLASAPMDESRQVSATGTFSATPGRN